MDIPIFRTSVDEAARAFIHTNLDEILTSGHLTMGKYTGQFEEMFAAFCGTKYAVAVGSGTAALEIILRALGIQSAAVIVPTNTFLATAFAVVHAGNRIIFADSEIETLCLDVEDVARRLAPDTRAVILVHIGGNITLAYQRLKYLCHERGLYLIEDCAHAHGCAIDGRKAGTLGIAGAFSFFPTKVLTTGEGGMIVTDDKGLYEAALMIRNHGKNARLGDRISEMGYNHRMSEITALLGVAQVRKAEALIANRRRAAAVYDRALRGIPGIRSVVIPENVFSTYYKYIVYLADDCDRDLVKEVMKTTYGVSLPGEVYTDLCHSEPVWSRFTYCGRPRANGRSVCSHGVACEQVTEGFPGAEYISRHHACLPLYPGLTQAELDYVVNSLGETLDQMRTSK